MRVARRTRDGRVITVWNERGGCCCFCCLACRILLQLHFMLYMADHPIIVFVVTEKPASDSYHNVQSGTEMQVLD